MLLTRFTILNHKSVKNVSLELAKGESMTLIGLNDVGKSTILKSLQLFFDDKVKILNEDGTSKKSTLSNSPLIQEEFDKALSNLDLPSLPNYSDSYVYIFCEFTLEKNYTQEEIDSRKMSDHLQYVIDGLKVEDKIHILKTLSASEDNYYLLCNDILEDEQNIELWIQNQARIKQVQARYAIKDSEIINRNGSGPLKNIERIKAIYKKKETQICWAKFDFKKDRASFPQFRYLDWNITSDELNQLTADIINPIVSKSLDPIRAEVNNSVKDINQQANDALAGLYAKYAQALPSSVTALSANVQIELRQSVTELFIKKLTSDDAVHIDEQGDGLRRQIGLGLVKALAEESIVESCEETMYIWCFDEPETHLYPQAQRDLAKNLALLSESSFQILTSTHSTLFVDRSKLKDIYQVSLVEGYTAIKSTGSTEDICNILGVRNSDFLFYDRFIAVEGQTEYYLLNHLYQIKYGRNLIDDGIQIINLKGKSNAKHYEKILGEILNDFQKTSDTVVYLFDKDTNKAGDNVILVGSVADFEDELSNELWQSLLLDKCDVKISNEELDGLRAGIDKDKSDTKMHVSLKNFVYSCKSHSDFLPGKGEALADALKDSFSTPEKIPSSIQRAFKMVRR